VSINLQNGDELHLNASSFWCEWFPRRKQEVCDRFTEAVRGLLSGSYRIVEHLRNGKAVKAKQCPDARGWRKEAVWSKVSFSFPWGKQMQILQNL
jgi:hypothetical protein